MKNLNQVQQQFRRYLAGEMNEMEVRNFILFVKDANNAELVEDAILSILDENDFSMRDSDTFDYDFVIQDSFDTLRSKIHANEINKKVTFLWKRYLLISAVVFLVFSFSFLVYFYQEGRRQNPLDNVIIPGTQSATLKLSNGKTILLSEAIDGEIANENGIQIIKEADGQIVYKVIGSASYKKDSYNELSTTRGESYKMQLPDGTQVWLNAESSLIYPTNINLLASRQVKLIGEGYFDVQKSSGRLFEVVTSKGVIQVLGTKFNISDYVDDKMAHVTLVEGKVKVVPSNGDGQILKPNEQLRIIEGNVSVQNVDVSEITAWKDGEFMFDKQTLEEIMKSISRWYDVEVEVSDDLKEIRIWGTISRYDDLSKVLKIIQSTDKSIKVKIDGRRVQLMR